GYSVPDNGKDRAPAHIPEIVLREYFLPPFKAAIKAGTHTLMVNSGEVNGIPLHASKYLLTDVLRTELGFEGVVISDWQDILKLHERHRVAATHKDAVLLAVNAGIDMCIVPFDFSFSNDLIALVKEGKITEERINASVRRILHLKMKLGLFKNPYIEHESKAYFAKPEYKQTAYQAAVEAVTLLKNESGCLPLSAQKRVLITGPASHLLSALHGAWSYSWQGDKEHLYPDTLNTLVEVFVKNKRVRYVPSVGFKNESWNKNAVIAAAKTSDVVILCLGEAPYAETPGNIPDLAFDSSQTELVKAVAATGKPIVVVLLEGRPRIIRDIEPLAKAILTAYWPCSQGAQAIHDVIYGVFNPCGKLPYTYPRYSGTLSTYDHKLLDEAMEVADPYKYIFEFTPQYEFGHGLSYTTFNYDTLQVSPAKWSGENDLKITVQVSNTGSRAGHEVVMVYTRDLYASVTPPVKRLKRFQKVLLNPGESKTLTFTLKREDLAFVDEKLQWIAEPGTFEVMVGNKKKSFVLE
ncbi:MAG TPA: glycoside hydrolase family 3 C-terminal domain-containing protein, partial [Cytophagales bacterium]|nr:glycoside hydrolase family 3 C-terminal domain-containing protein [Cytophagales bacterium]